MRAHWRQCCLMESAPPLARWPSAGLTPEGVAPVVLNACGISWTRPGGRYAAVYRRVDDVISQYINHTYTMHIPHTYRCTPPPTGRCRPSGRHWGRRGSYWTILGALYSSGVGINKTKQHTDTGKLSQGREPEAEA